MSIRTLAAWSIGAIAVGLAIEGILLSDGSDTGLIAAPAVLLPVALGGTGALITSRRPTNPIGWIFSAQGFSIAFEALATGYIGATGRSSSATVDALAPVLAWIVSWVWVLTLAASGAFLPLLFPEGHLVSRKWALVGWLAAASATLAAVSRALRPGPLDGAPNYMNPVGIEPLGPVLDATTGIALVVLALAMLASAGSLVIRFRRARGPERQQLKWFAYGAAFAAVGLPAGAALWNAAPESAGLAQALIGVAFLSLVTGVANAVLRYRLYDIDVIIRRTLVYAAVTGSLGLVYWASVVVLQELLRPLTRESDVAIIASTLAVAALFQPARRGIQGAVDRRFYRSRYDAARTLEAFGASLRQQFDLDSISASLLDVVRETVQPNHAGLWLRGPRGDTGISDLVGPSRSP